MCAGSFVLVNMCMHLWPKSCVDKKETLPFYFEKNGNFDRNAVILLIRTMYTFDQSNEVSLRSGWAESERFTFIPLL